MDMTPGEEGEGHWGPKSAYQTRFVSLVLFEWMCLGLNM